MFYILEHESVNPFNYMGYVFFSFSSRAELNSKIYVIEKIILTYYTYIFVDIKNHTMSYISW